MKTDELLVLADEVEFVPVISINEKLRKAFEYEPDDIIITLRNSRIKSKVISSEFARLLQEFSSPKTLAEVIYNFANLHQNDPLQLADKSFSQLMKLKKAGILISYNKENIPLQKSIFSEGEQFRDYTIIKKWRGMEDTEVYQVRDTNAKLFALKILKASMNDHIKSMYDNELKTLQDLDGRVNPVMTEHDRHEEHLFMVMEWCAGLPLLDETSKYRNINTRKNVLKLLDIAIAVADAFYHLHSQEVLHGDIHPSNILITEKGLVKIVDYGYAAKKGNKNSIQRAGTGFYYEPEFAEAVVNNKTRPSLTERGEQYSVAVVLYKIITGNTYLDFSLDPKKLYWQLMQEEPIAFREYDLQLPPELEQVLAKALSKNPENRYESIKHFADALREVQNNIFNSAVFFTVNRENGEKQFVDFLIHKFGWNSGFIDKGLQASPTCSVYYGSAGIAYMFYRIACVRQDPAFASLADTWINRAQKFKTDPGNSFSSSTIGITAETAGKISIYHSPSGVYLIEALINNANGNNYALSKSLDEFLRAARVPNDKLDLALGKTGLLTGCSLLLRELKTREGFQTRKLEDLADAIMQELWSHLDTCKPIQDDIKTGYLGIAHGWAGYLYATLQWCSIASRKLPAGYLNRMEQLLDCAVQKNNSIYWPYSVKDKTLWQGWCNGSAGHTFLWLLAFNYFKDPKFLDIAEKLTNHFTPQLLGSNCNLCCGMAGQAYAMLSLYKITGENRHLETVKWINKLLLKNISSPQLRNNSLYKGEVGLGVLFCESEIPTLARMPLFE